MEQRLSIVTLGVADLARAAAFYEALGWRRAGLKTDAVVAFDAGGVVVALSPRAALGHEAGFAGDPGPGAFGGITLAHNVESPEAVDAAIAAMVAAGARLLRPAAKAGWGGYTGYVADPDGHPWEIAWNPYWPLDADGRVQLPG
jgi:catechol 2,3-dioxygenase-like lactoylglutathione lyase family enzyme